MGRAWFCCTGFSAFLLYLRHVLLEEQGGGGKSSDASNGEGGRGRKQSVDHKSAPYYSLALAGKQRAACSYMCVNISALN